MHELALCEAVADTVVRHADGQPVSRVEVRIGHFRQVVPDAMQFSWKVLTEGGELDGCELAIEHVPAVVACRRCGQETRLELPILMCGSCHSDDVELVRGNEFAVVAIERVAAR
jgi:hydrogenase nickel incorporation protein HypA/HybF